MVTCSLNPVVRSQRHVRIFCGLGLAISSMRCVEGIAVRWRLVSSIALVVLLRLTGCQAPTGLE